MLCANGMQQTLEVNVLKSEVKFTKRGGDEAERGERGEERKARRKVNEGDASAEGVITRPYHTIDADA